MYSEERGGKRFTPRYFLVEFDTLSEPEKVARCVQELDVEVHNGGFEQYFTNSSGERAHYVLHALAALGAHHCRRITAEAIQVVGEAVLREDWEQRARRVSALDEIARARLDELDDQFYAHPDDLSKLLPDYWRAHPNEFADAW